MALTDTAVRKAKPDATAYALRDGEIPYLWATPTGSNLWRCDYRFEGRRS